MATTAYRADYLGRALRNEDPGTTDPALDHLGREVQMGDVDYMDRELTDEAPVEP